MSITAIVLTGLGLAALVAAALGIRGSASPSIQVTAGEEAGWIEGAPASPGFHWVILESRDEPSGIWKFCHENPGKPMVAWSHGWECHLDIANYGGDCNRWHSWASIRAHCPVGDAPKFDAA